MRVRSQGQTGETDLEKVRRENALGNCMLLREVASTGETAQGAHAGALGTCVGLGATPGPLKSYT